MKKELFLIPIIFFIASCINHNTATKKKIGDYIVESKFKNDSIPDGLTKYYNLNGQLRSMFNFSDGVKNGAALNYNDNGKVHDSINYSYGKMNGWHYVYDTLGQLVFKNYFFFGQRIGEEIFYKNDSIKAFAFINFEKKRIFSCAYDSIGITGASGDILHVSSYGINSDNRRQQGVFVYLIYPPKVFVKYSLGIINEETKERKETLVLQSSNFFWDTILPAPNKNWKYYVSAQYIDSINKVNEVNVSIIEN
ncbi:MAG: hypothetical protein KGZ74_07145 [Chitinophagaceae bacterium]|nr:hypothetical protein [Chitinophagaceae bacterium]